MSEPPESPVPHDAHALLTKAGGILRAHLTQEEREDWLASWWLPCGRRIPNRIPAPPLSSSSSRGISRNDRPTPGKAKVENDRITSYRINAKITFAIEGR
jgi:hypothetical protein